MSVLQMRDERQEMIEEKGKTESTATRRLITCPRTTTGQLGEDAAPPYQGLVCALLRDDAVVYDNDSVAHTHHLEFVCHNECGPADPGVRKRLHDGHLVFRV